MWWPLTHFRFTMSVKSPVKIKTNKAKKKIPQGYSLLIFLVMTNLMTNAWTYTLFYFLLVCIITCGFNKQIKISHTWRWSDRRNIQAQLWPQWIICLNFLVQIGQYCDKHNYIEFVEHHRFALVWPLLKKIIKHCDKITSKTF